MHLDNVLDAGYNKPNRELGSASLNDPEVRLLLHERELGDQELQLRPSHSPFRPLTATGLPGYQF